MDRGTLALVTSLVPLAVAVTEGFLLHSVEGERADYEKQIEALSTAVQIAASRRCE